jgi:site-specific DNA-cytosine methylase
LAEIGYDAEWQVLSAAQFGAWHLRRRIFIVAYPNSLRGAIGVEAEFDLEWTNDGVQGGWSKSSNTSQRCRPTITPADPEELQRNGCDDYTGFSAQPKEISEFGDSSGENATSDATSQPHRRQNNTPGCEVARADNSAQWGEKDASSSGDCGEKTFPHTNRIFTGGTNQTLCGREGGMGFGFGCNRQYVRSPKTAMAHTNITRRNKQRRPLTVFPEQFASERYSWWKAESRICRVYDGIPNRVDRLKSLGNAVVPQVAEYLGKLILNHSRLDFESSGKDTHSNEPY